MKNNHHRITTKFLFCLPFILLLTACVSGDISGLEAEVEGIMARKGAPIEPLPEIKLYEAYTYSSGSTEVATNSPFKLFYVVSRPETADGVLVDDGLTEEMKREIENRNRQELEQFALDSLRMVGTIDNENNNWAIILDPSGVVHRVGIGNYIGENIGKIINIFEDRVELREIIQDGDGRWSEREAALALIE